MFKPQFFFYFHYHYHLTIILYCFILYRVIGWDGKQAHRVDFSFLRVLPVDSFVTNDSALVNVVFCTIVLYYIY